MTTRKVGFVGLMIVVMPALLLGFLSDPSNQRSALPGYYRVQLGKWSGQFPSGLWVEHTPPLVFKLDTVNLAPPFDDSGLKRVMPATLIVRRGSFPAGWRVVGLDTIMVRWSTGLPGCVSGSSSAVTLLWSTLSRSMTSSVLRSRPRASLPSRPHVRQIFEAIAA